jgi:hypothetical protein
MKNVHILNGDALLSMLQQYGIGENYVVIREALVEGPVSPTIDEKFFEARANFIASAFKRDTSEYVHHVVNEVEKLYHLDNSSNVYVWFEHDLFCQTNLWFVLAFLKKQNFTGTVRRVSPLKEASDTWSGFGRSTKENLQEMLRRSVVLTEEDLLLGQKLWIAYASGDNITLRSLSNQSNDHFPFLQTVIEAHLDRTSITGLGRPQRVLKEILQSGQTEFPKIFREFSIREGIYGFGDDQVKRMLDQLD